MKITAISFNKRKTKQNKSEQQQQQQQQQNSYLKFKPNQFPKSDKLFEIDLNPQENKPTYASILQKARKQI